METILIVLIVIGVLLMAAGLLVGRRRRVAVLEEPFAVDAEGAPNDAAGRAGEAVAVAHGGEAIDEGLPRG